MLLFLADTNVLSELIKSRPDAGVVAWSNGVSRLALSVITIEEIQYGLARRPNAVVAAWYEQALLQIAEPLPVTVAIARVAGTLRGQLAARGVARTQADMLIAATAQVHRLTLVTRNTRDFESCGIGLLNPFAADQ
jgi:predicted nucleic acid-binding protein